MKKFIAYTVFVAGVLTAMPSQAQPRLVAVGTLDQSSAGLYTDLSGLNYDLENGVRANELGGTGSALTYAGGNTFLSVPDRGPNAVAYNSAVDDTVSYISRFHTITMDLKPNASGSGLPYTLTPQLQATTLLSILFPPIYGTGQGLGLGSGAPAANQFLRNYFTGRSDNFDPSRDSGNSRNARLDPEGMRLSNDGRSVFFSDEYGPYVYQFDRVSGLRLRSFRLPSSFYVKNLRPTGDDEIADNTSGRVANSGMEGLAITPDGRTLVGIMQAALIQDASAGATKLLRIVTIDIATARATHQFAYLLTKGSGVSEIVALNDHEFLVDERDGSGRGNGNKAKVKQIFKIDVASAVDVAAMEGSEAAGHAVSKTLFLDVVDLLTRSGIDAAQIPAKIEGISFGPDVQDGPNTLHTLWLSNDNDFEETVADANGQQIANPNQFFVVGFADGDLGGSTFAPQQVQAPNF